MLVFFLGELGFFLGLSIGLVAALLLFRLDPEGINLPFLLWVLCLSFGLALS